MKTSTILASLLFDSFAAAAAALFHRRALVYKTEIVTETVVVYTTVYDDGAPAPTSSVAPTSSPATICEQQKPAPTSTAVPTPATALSTPAALAYNPPVVEQPKPKPSPSPSPAPQPQPAPQPELKPEPSQAPAPSAPAPAPAPIASSASAAAPPTPKYSTGGSSGGAAYQDVDITVYDNTGAAGACGEPLTDDMMVVAISKGAWDAKGGSTYNIMTGASSNPWCGTEIKIDYNGATAKAKIMDLCPGCIHTNDIDLSRGVWKALGITETTRLKASWSIL